MTLATEEEKAAFLVWSVAVQLQKADNALNSKVCRLCQLALLIAEKCPGSICGA